MQKAPGKIARKPLLNYNSLKISPTTAIGNRFDFDVSAASTCSELVEWVGHDNRRQLNNGSYWFLRRVFFLFITNRQVSSWLLIMYSKLCLYAWRPCSWVKCHQGNCIDVCDKFVVWPAQDHQITEFNKKNLYLSPNQLDQVGFTPNNNHKHVNLSCMEYKLNISRSE